MDNLFVYSLHHRGRTLHSIPNTRVAVLYNESATGVKTKRRGEEKRKTAKRGSSWPPHLVDEQKK
jgi:hypothetical protein